MASITEQLQSAVDSKTAIKEALVEKGVDMDGVAFSGYADKIASIYSEPKWVYYLAESDVEFSNYLLFPYNSQEDLKLQLAKRWKCTYSELAGNCEEFYYNKDIEALFLDASASTTWYRRSISELPAQSSLTISNDSREDGLYYEIYSYSGWYKDYTFAQNGLPENFIYNNTIYDYENNPYVFDPNEKVSDFLARVDGKISFYTCPAYETTCPRCEEEVIDETEHEVEVTIDGMGSSLYSCATYDDQGYSTLYTASEYDSITEDPSIYEIDTTETYPSEGDSYYTSINALAPGE